jgi:hypothetical protein
MYIKIASFIYIISRIITLRVLLLKAVEAKITQKRYNTIPLSNKRSPTLYKVYLVS